ncbi:MAG: DUF1214 domain-containing protein [Myxococcota bacterium]|jgi:hypothetical protein|nr:DUF1214 domain-containing protein [Myxococcota bacterium]
MTDSAQQKVIDGSAWEEFCDSLKEAGKLIDSEKAPQDAFNRAEGYRYLTRMLRAGLESFIEYADKDFAVLRSGAHETIKMGADNPDNRYESAGVNPANDYRIVGTRGTVDYLGISTVANLYSQGKSMVTTGFLDSRDMEISENGRIEIILSKNEQPGNWIPMTDETNQVNVRQTFQDRVNEKRAELKLERIGAEGERPEPFSADKLVRGLQGATRFLRNTTGMFENWAESFLPDENTLPHADQAYCQMIGGDPNIHYFHSYWKLADDEALVLEAAKIPECQTWNFQLDNWWMESLDYVNHTIHVNKTTAHYEPDGSVKVIVSHTDPGHPNWIETAGHNNGTMCWRWIGATEHPDVETRVVKASEL